MAICGSYVGRFLIWGVPCALADDAPGDVSQCYALSGGLRKAQLLSSQARKLQSFCCRTLAPPNMDRTPTQLLSPDL